MKTNLFILITVLLSVSQTACTQQIKKMKYNSLTPEEQAVILHKATERPFTGEYLDNKAQGTYVCKQCGAALYRSEDKFE